MVDASIVTKWVLSGENYEENAAKLKAEYVAGRVDLSAPSFMVQEVTNSIWKAIKQKRITPEIAQKALENRRSTNPSLRFKLDGNLRGIDDSYRKRFDRL